MIKKWKYCETNIITDIYMIDYGDLLIKFKERVRLFIVQIEIQKQYITGIGEEQKLRDDKLDNNQNITINKGNDKSNDIGDIIKDITQKFDVLKLLLKEMLENDLDSESLFQKDPYTPLDKFEKFIGSDGDKSEKNFKAIIDLISKEVNSDKNTFQMEDLPNFKKHNDNFMARNRKFVGNMKSILDSVNPMSENELKYGKSVPHDALVVFMKHPENEKVINKILPINAMNEFSMMDIVNDKIYEIETGLDFMVNEGKEGKDFFADLFRSKNVMSSDYDYVTGEDGDDGKDGKDGKDTIKIPGRLKTQVLHKASFPKEKQRPSKQKVKGDNAE